MGHFDFDDVIDYVTWELWTCIFIIMLIFVLRQTHDQTNIFYWNLKNKPTPHLSRSWPRSNLIVIEAFSSFYMFAFIFVVIGPFWLRYSKFQIWPWKFIVKVVAKVKSYGHIWGWEFNRYVCYLFRGNRTIIGWDIANSIFDPENSRSRLRPMSNPMVTFEAQSSID